MVTNPIGCSLCFLIVVFPTLNAFSVAWPSGVALSWYSFQYFQRHALVLGKWSAIVFADDTDTYFASNNNFRNTLQSELQLLLEWICESRLVLNVVKTKTMIFRDKQATNKHNQLCLSLKGDTEQVQQTILLRTTLDEQPS